MDESFLKNCSLFEGVPVDELRDCLASVPQHIQCYEKDEPIFRFMEEAHQIGIIMEGKVKSLKPFPNGSQINVSVRLPGDMIGPAAVFSKNRHYPCDVIAEVPTTVVMFRKEDILKLLQKDIRILENFTRDMATAAYILQERLEMLSYSGIAQKAAYYLLMQRKRTGLNEIRIPESVSNWALILDVSRPSLHRELKKMEAEGMISVQTPVIRILNEESLQAVLA